MDNETLAALERVEEGMASAQDLTTLRQALLTLAPSSGQYRRIIAAVRPQAVSETPSPALPSQRDDDRSPEIRSLGDLIPRFAEGGAFSGGVPGIGDVLWGRSTPTADFLSDERGDSWFEGGGPGTPTLDWLGGAIGRYPDEKSNEVEQFIRGDQELNPQTPASRADAQGSRPIGSGTQAVEPDSTRMDSFGITPGGENPYEDAPIEMFTDIPQGYSFSDYNRGGLSNLMDDPEYYARTFAKQRGGEQYSQLYSDPAKAAIAMARAGIIGPQGQPVGNDLRGAIGMPESYQLQAVEEFMRDYTTKGRDVRPSAIYSEMFERAENTDLSSVQSPQTGEPLSTNEIIDYTNASLMAAAPFMTQEGQAWLSGILARAGSQYMDYIGTTSEVDPSKIMSYPQFLRSIGINDLMQGQ